MQFTTLNVILFGISSFLTGLAKTSVGGLGIIIVPLMAMVFPGKESVGVLLPMLITADIIAVILYRRGTQWKIIARISPFVCAGIAAGAVILYYLPDINFSAYIGGVILVMQCIELLDASNKVNLSTRTSLPLTVLTGVLAGMFTMVANAAGPLMAVYFLQQRLDKKEFVGTSSMYFLLLNLFKVPFSASLGLITAQSLKMDLFAVPVIIIGAAAGYGFLKLINVTAFRRIIRVLAFAASVKLLFF